jgi:hypothetical protein
VKAETLYVTPVDKPLPGWTVNGNSTVKVYCVPGGCLQSFRAAADCTLTIGGGLSSVGSEATRNCPVAIGLTPEAQGGLPVYVACTSRL